MALGADAAALVTSGADEWAAACPPLRRNLQLLAPDEVTRDRRLLICYTHVPKKRSRRRNGRPSAVADGFARASRYFARAAPISPVIPVAADSKFSRFAGHDAMLCALGVRRLCRLVRFHLVVTLACRVSVGEYY